MRLPASLLIAPAWCRGTAFVTDSVVAFEPGSVTGYERGDAATMLDRFTQIDDPKDIAAFATDFGLMWRGPFRDQAHMDATDEEWFQEPLDQWFHWAGTISATLVVVGHIRRIERGNQKSIGFLRQLLRSEHGDLEALKVQASEHAASIVRQLMAHTTLGFESLATWDNKGGPSGKPGSFAYAPVSLTLLGHIGLELAEVLTSPRPVDLCADCEQYFQPTHGSQTLCAACKVTRRGRNQRYRAKLWERQIAKEGKAR